MCEQRVQFLCRPLLACNYPSNPRGLLIYPKHAPLPLAPSILNGRALRGVDAPPPPAIPFPSTPLPAHLFQAPPTPASFSAFSSTHENNAAARCHHAHAVHYDTVRRLGRHMPLLDGLALQPTRNLFSPHSSIFRIRCE